MKNKQSIDFLNRMTARVVSMNSSRQNKHSKRVQLDSSSDALDAWTTIKNLSRRLEESLDLITNPEAFRGELYALSRELQDFADRTAYEETLSSSCALDSAKKDPSAEVASIYSDLKKRVQKLLEDKVPKTNPTLKKMQDKIEELERTYSAKKLQVALNSSWDEDELDETEGWELIAVKSVPDSDGFMTEYAWWHRDSDEMNAMIFGDTEIYNPTNTHWDFESEDDDLAEEWFRLYEGFQEDDEDFDSSTDLNSSTEGDSFLVSINHGEKIIQIQKKGNKWYESFVSGDSSNYVPGSYMGYLEPSDILNWLYQDFGDAEIVSEDSISESDNESADVGTTYYFAGDNSAGYVTPVDYGNRSVWEGWVYSSEFAPPHRNRQFESNATGFTAMQKELSKTVNDDTIKEVDYETFQKKSRSFDDYLK